jgi:N-dimethylarginine dimethylaminohydrolase
MTADSLVRLDGETAISDVMDPVRDPGPSPEVCAALMVRPDQFDVTYRINPWMTMRHPVDRGKAWAQWKALYETLAALGVQIHVIDPGPGLCDMVFAANAGMIHRGRAVVSRFRYRQRQQEEDYFLQWFCDQGLEVCQLPNGCFWEGQACCTFVDGYFLCSLGERANAQAYSVLASIWGIPKGRIHYLPIVDPHFYHLDIALCMLDPETCLVYPKAFRIEDYRWLQAHVRHAIPVDMADALRFACNGFPVDHTIVMNAGVSERLEERLFAAGYEIAQLDASEFHKSGGGVKCLAFRYAPGE